MPVVAETINPNQSRIDLTMCYNIFMTDRNEINEREKIKFTMITNITGQENKKTIDMRLNAKLIGFIELYE